MCFSACHFACVSVCACIDVVKPLEYTQMPMSYQISKHYFFLGNPFFFGLSSFYVNKCIRIDEDKMS